MRDILPEVAYRRVAVHLLAAGYDAETGYESTEEDEDSVTGDLMRAFRRRPHQVIVDGQRWTWSVVTKKFRGRGPSATENLIGADGIIQIDVKLPSGELVRKGLLFQAKNRGRRDGLDEQIRKMESAAPGGSAVFDYGLDGYFAYRGSDGSNPLGRLTAVRLGDFLAGEFLACHVGRLDTWFSWEERALHLPSEATLPRWAWLVPRFVLGIRVAAPR